jgi:hypothetical protein
LHETFFAVFITDAEVFTFFNAVSKKSAKRGSTRLGFEVSPLNTSKAVFLILLVKKRAQNGEVRIEILSFLGHNAQFGLQTEKLC